MTDITATLAEALKQADELLRIARWAVSRLGLRDRGSDCSLPHEVRSFALHFSPEGRDGPGALQVRGLGACDAVLKSTGEALATYSQHTEAQASGTEGERAAFEAAMAAEGYEISQTRYRDGTYRSQEYAAGWAMWQARAAIAPAPAAAQGDAREQFEEEVRKWFDPNRAAELLARGSADGDYEEWGVMLAWESYKAAHELGRQQGMEQERALWQMAKDAQESGMYDDALCAPASDEMAKDEQAVPVAWRADAPASEAEQGRQLDLAREDQRLFLLGVTVNGWRVPPHLVSVFGSPPAMERRPLTESELRAEFKRLQQDGEERLVMDLPDFIAGAECRSEHAPLGWIEEWVPKSLVSDGGLGALIWKEPTPKDGLIPIYLHPPTPAAELRPTARDVLKNAFALCEWIEDVPDGAKDSQEVERFKAGQRSAAKWIRNGIGTWFQDESRGITAGTTEQAKDQE